MRYLIIAPSWVGDLVIAAGLFNAIKMKDPAAHLSILASPWNEPLLARMNQVDTVIPVDLPHGGLHLKKRWQVGRSLKGQFDVAVVLPNSWKSALIPFFAQIPIRRGWLGEFRYGLLNQIFKNPKQYVRLSDRFLALANEPGQTTSLPKMNSALQPDLSPNLKVRSELVERLNIQLDKPILALCPGAAFGSAKRWPTHHFQTLAEDFLKRGWQIWIFGTAQEKILAEAILGVQPEPHLDRRIFCGVVSLAETADLLSLSSCVISNDSGLMHVAAALDRPTIGLYGSTSPAYTPPQGTYTQILINPLPCQPCFKRECPLGHLACLENLKPEQVIAAILSWEAIAHA